jgi:LCP family protein required for cell wall assembly
METSSQRRYPRQRRNGNALLKAIGLIVLALFACGGLFFAYQIYDTVREAVIALGLPDIGELPVISAGGAQPTREPLPNIAVGERVNVLVLGIDRRPSEKCPCRTDTMILVTLDPKAYTAGVLTIPRDLYVTIPTVGENRINTAAFYGELYKYPGGGPGLAKKTIEYNFGRPVHYYVLVDFAGFRKVVDALGGIDIDVPKPINDPEYPDENFGYSPLYIPAGRIHMNGDLALKYARTRHQDGDFGRSKRQIQVLMAIRDKALRLDILPKLPALLQSMWGTLETDMNPTEVLALAQVGAKVKTENIKSGSIDQTMTVQFRTSNGADVLWFDRAKVGQLIEQIIPQDNVGGDLASRVQQEGARITILNGTTTPQLAERTAKYLQTQNFQIASYGNADRFDYPKTVLIDYNGKKVASLSALTKIFHVEPNNIRYVSNVNSDSDIRIILGADWTLPQ